MAKYDENLSENHFLLYLKSACSSILRRAAKEGWLVCVPRAATIGGCALTQMDVLKHVLVPDPQDDNLFTTLTDQRVCLRRDSIIIKVDDPVSGNDTQTTINVLFSENVYDEYGKYKLLCLENPLFTDTLSDDLIVVTCLQDATNLLCHDVNNFDVMRKLDVIAADTSKLCEDINTLEVVRQHFSQAFIDGCALIQSKGLIKEKLNKDSYYRKSIFLAVESYLQYKMFPVVIEALNMIAAERNSVINLNICNAAQIQEKDLNVLADHNILTRAKHELQALTCFHTAIEKMECLRRVSLTLSKVQNKMSSDELLPYFVLLVIRVALPNWFSHLLFMKYFTPSSEETQSASENNFHVATLEAALEYVELGSVFYTKQSVVEYNKEDSGYFMLKSEADSMGKSTSSALVAHYFEQIKLGNNTEVKNSLEKCDSVPLLLEEHLCHPLCRCINCVSKLNELSLERVAATVGSRDSRGCTGLHIACAFGWPKVVKVLLRKGSSTNAVDNNLNTPLHYAAQKGHKNCLLLLLHAEASVNCVNSHGNTPLHLATMNGHAGCVKGLVFYSELNGSIDCNGQNRDGNTPLHLACKWGHKESAIVILDRLLELGCHLMMLNKKKLTPAQSCCDLQLKKIVNKTQEEIGLCPDVPTTPVTDALISRRSSIDSGCQSQNSPYIAATTPACSFPEQQTAVSQSQSSPYIAAITPACSFPQQQTSASLPFNKPSVVSSTIDTSGIMEKALRAVKVNDIKLACYYLSIPDKVSSESSLENGENGAKVSTTCHPLCQCTNCYTDGAQARTPATTHLNKIGQEGLGVLQLASSLGHTELVSILLSNGCHPDLVAGNGVTTALHMASTAGHAGVVQLLLQRGASVSACDACGNTPLHMAAASGCTNSVDYLLAKGADHKAANLDGNRPFDIALQLGHSEIGKKLL